MSENEEPSSAPLYHWGREMQSYDAGQLKTLLGAQDDEELCSLILRLKSASVLRTVAASNKKANEETNDAWQTQWFDRYRYKFSYVGILQNCNKAGCNLLYILPKYCRRISAEAHGEEAEQRMRHFQTVLQVINRYAQNNETQGYESEAADVDNPLAIKIELLTDYVNNGAYRDDEHVDEINGNGRILWQRTIQTTQPFLSDERPEEPVYMELHTRRKQDDEQNFFTRLHHYLAHDAYEQLERYHLGSLLGLPCIPPPEDAEDAFQERDYVLNRLAGELSVQFDSRRRLLLELMRRYLNDEGNTSADSLFVFGKSGFHVVWEEVCRSVLSMRKTTKADLPDSCPKWTVWSSGSSQQKDGSPMEADMFNKTADSLLICDAKYYKPSASDAIDTIIKDMPGVGDIMKQQVYEYALNPGAAISKVVNIFLLPALENDGITDTLFCMGKVTIPALRNTRPIYIFKVRPAPLWESYLSNTPVSQKRLWQLAERMEAKE